MLDLVGSEFATMSSSREANLSPLAPDRQPTLSAPTTHEIGRKCANRF
jgi:hypothetical protein